MSQPLQAPASAPAPASGGEAFLRFLKKNWLALLLSILALILIIENLALFTMVDVTLYFWTLRLPLWLLLAVVFVGGGVSGWVFARRRARQRQLAASAAAAQPPRR